MEKVSVIIPVKNRASLLPETLENILNQTLKPYEIIVVDDHSEDNLWAVIQRYKDRVTFIKSSGKGPGASRNAGFKISTGNYIQFFDSDDLMTINKLEVQAQLLSARGSGMCYCPHFKASLTSDNHWNQESPMLYYHPLENSLRYDQWVIRGACMITQACLFDRNIFKECGLWRTDLMTHEDLELLFRIGKVVPYPIHTNKVSVLYRQHGEQITDKIISDDSRTVNQFNAWSYIKENMQAENYSYWDFLMIQENLFHSYQFLNSKDKIEVKERFDMKYQLLDLCYRIQNKFNRIKTDSDWQPFHGISKSQEVFIDFINKIKINKNKIRKQAV
jgi:glycosyltransferase involved in cell wall biosynthesis